MPNNVTNEITIRGVLRHVIEPLLFDRQGNFTFEALVPIPPQFWQGSVHLDHNNKPLGPMKLNAMDWARENWGTKWDAYGKKKLSYNAEGDVLIEFTTAWSAPYPWMNALFRALKTEISYSYHDEGKEYPDKGRFWIDVLGRNDWEESPAPELSDHYGLNDVENDEATT
jgi:hypothetical protein